MPSPSDSSVEIVNVQPNCIVSNLEAAKAFYVGKLGFTVVTEDEEHGSFALVARGGARIGLLPAIEGHRVAGHGSAYLTVVEVEALHANFTASGVERITALQKWGDVTEFTLKDPDGNHFDVGNIGAVTE